MKTGTQRRREEKVVMTMAGRTRTVRPPTGLQPSSCKT